MFWKKNWKFYFKEIIFFIEPRVSLTVEPEIDSAKVIFLQNQVEVLQGQVKVLQDTLAKICSNNWNNYVCCFIIPSYPVMWNWDA